MAVIEKESLWKPCDLRQLYLSESEIHYAAPGFYAVRQLPVFHAPIDTKIPQAERRSASDRKQEEKNKDMDDWDDFHDS
ncbi:hypothetical protein [Fusicatenibacter saccharivorans]|uniref:hypothetical protein n=1 Tax=Fusicatenibacter saccharivorans TaxID=1150298 RepID=UPI0032C0BA2E